MITLKNKKLLKKQLFQQKKKRNITQIEKGIIKMEHYKISKLINNSTAFKFATKMGRSK